MVKALWFTVLVIVILQDVFARDCVLSSIRNCNECIRCKGTWCNKPNDDGEQCMHSSDDNCPEDKEDLFRFKTEEGVHYINKTLLLTDTKDTRRFSYVPNTEKFKVTPQIVDSTIGDITSDQVMMLIYNTNCVKGNCTANLEVKLTKDFCPAHGTNREFFTVAVKLDDGTEVYTATYHVPCACDCSIHEKVEINSPKCDSKGDYLGCGTCSCKGGWFGGNCRKECNRRDIPTSCVSLINDKDGDCSGNGHCVDCECQCRTNTNTTYFGGQCDQICKYIEYHCDNVILNEDPKCDKIIFEKMNNTVFEKHNWERCQMTIEHCHIEYVARAEGDKAYVMVTKDCNSGAAGSQIAESINVAGPVIAAVVVALASVAALGGYIYYKNRLPKPMTGSPYSPMNPEGAAGINPIYKSPTSSYQNPKYGKW